MTDTLTLLREVRDSQVRIEERHQALADIVAEHHKDLHHPVHGVVPQQRDLKTTVRNVAWLVALVVPAATAIVILVVQRAA